ncbi:MAG: polysaccharide deacetylase family protein [Chloroflexota bacterium]|nr:polysaccharide deacetylase family protein [Chloroflexota bacterium]
MHGRFRRAGVSFAGSPFSRPFVRLLELAAGWPNGAFVVLTYHRIAEAGEDEHLYPSLVSATPQGFERQMEFVGRRLRPVSLDHLAQAHHGAVHLPRHAVLVTFDDAYADFARNAWPTLRRLGIPVTLFVPTAYPGARDRPFWWDRLWAAMTMTGRRGALQTPVGKLLLGDDQQRRTAARSLVDRHRALPHAEAMVSVETICRLLRGPEPVSATLTWDELRTLASQGVTLAPHSQNHPLLTTVDSATQRSELERSRQTLFAEMAGLGHQLAGAAVAYPSGAYDRAVLGATRECGYELAFTTRRGLNRLAATHPLRLRRINVGARSGPELISAQISIGAVAIRATA